MRRGLGWRLFARPETGMIATLNGILVARLGIHSLIVSLGGASRPGARFSPTA